MVVLRNRKNTQEHQVAFAEAKAKAQAQAKAEAEAKLQAEAEAKTDKIQEWLVACAKIQELLDAPAKAEAEAKAKAEAEAKAAELEKLNRVTYKMWCYWEHDIGSTPTFNDVSRLIEDYACRGFPVPKVLIETMCELIKDFSTTIYPEPEEELVPLVAQHCPSSEPCACEVDDKWADDEWFTRHYASGDCHAYKPWI